MAKTKRLTDKNTEFAQMTMIFLIIFFLFLYIALALSSMANMQSTSISAVIGEFSSDTFSFLLNPTQVMKHKTSESIMFSIWVSSIITLLLVVFYLEGKTGKLIPGIVHGSSKWLYDVAKHWKKEPREAKEYRKDMMDERFVDNLMFDNTYGISMNTRKTLRNLHTLVIGGSGAGKTRFFVKPNILQMNASYIITDPSGELYRDMGQMLMDNNYDVRVFNTFDVNASMQYNPLSYINPESAGTEVTDLVTTLIKNTGEATGDNKYFDDATKLLLTAIILFLVEYCPKSDRDFSHVMKLVLEADVPEGQSNAKSGLDKIFEQVEVVDPESLALATYKSFKTTAGKTLKAVLSSTAVRLNFFNFPEIKRLTCADTISLKTIGDEKTALFIITPPIDNGFNFLVAMMYSQLFSKLYYHTTFECHYLLTDNNYIARPFASKEDAQHVKDLLTKQFENQGKSILEYEYDVMIGKYEMVEVETGNVLMSELREETVKRFKENPGQFTVKQNTAEEAGSPFHIRMLMDEFANINEIPGFQEVLATIRKYNISVAIILQSLSQLKKRYEADYDPIIGNCDTFIFLGANSLDTAEHISKALGEITTLSKSMSKSNGKKNDYTVSIGEQGRPLMTVNEVQQLPNDEQIVMVRAIYPMKLKKFKLEEHPNFKLSADYDKTKRLSIKKCHDLKKKIAEIEKQRNGEETREGENEERPKIERSYEAWKNKPIGKNVKGKEDKSSADEFFF